MNTSELLTPEFIAFADKVKALYHAKEDKVKAFKEVYIAHKAEIEDLDKQAAALKKEFEGGK